ncbi:hypothetical protein M3148_03055 [Georgenia satyanarayanai]|uniref:hypothetical protein n=1 Tax=Georgenia satyanarayanai TaxID=860221 RepID=UPI002040D479|nr:hypothetical protein [Georgenia satyanarayanai]MCM3659978.1 hypothetical protein [Georgenia satyanarayanai]
MSRDDAGRAAMCVIRAEQQAPGRQLFTVSILGDLSTSAPPRKTVTLAPQDVVRLVEAFLEEVAGDE